MPGYFISFEGTEGCGKSTHIRKLTDRLEADGHTVRAIREPGGTDSGEQIRILLKHGPENLTPEAELLLMNASRAQLVQEAIRPALAKGTVVLCDRFYDSSLAYQGYGRGLDLAKVQQAIDLAVGETKPNLTLLLDISLSVSQARVSGRQRTSGEGQDQFDESGLEFFERVHAGFHALAKEEPERYRVIDGAQPPDAVGQAVWDCVAPLL